MVFLNGDATSESAAGFLQDNADNVVDEGAKGKVGSSTTGSWNTSAAPFVPGGSADGSAGYDNVASAWELGQNVYDESAWQDGDSSGQNVYNASWGAYTSDGTMAYDETAYMGIGGASADHDWLQCGVLDSVLDVLGEEVATGPISPEELESMTAPDSSYHDGSYHTTPDLNPTVAFDSNIGFHTLGMNVVDAEEAAQRPSNYKTLICRHYERGHCSRGPTCNFAHGHAELRSHNVNAALAVQKKDSPRSQLLTMCGAWGALHSGPCPHPAVDRMQMLGFRLCEIHEPVPAELQTLCVSDVDQARREKVGK